MKIDLHTHTKGSDGIGTPEEIAGYACRAGLDGICLTDHHSTYNAENLKVAKACRAVGLLVIHGCEYSSAGGHMLVYGVDIEDLRLGFYEDPQLVIDRVNAAGGVAIPSHPYKGYKRKFEDRVKFLRDIPALEVANGQCAFQKPEVNELAVGVAEVMKVRGTGGSDAHNPRHIGLTYTVFETPICCERDFIRELKYGRYHAETHRKLLKKEIRRRRRAGVAGSQYSRITIDEAREGQAQTSFWSRFPAEPDWVVGTIVGRSYDPVYMATDLEPVGHETSPGRVFFNGNWIDVPHGRVDSVPETGENLGDGQQLPGKPK